MKKITKILTTIAAILLLFSGCKKDDIRDKYIGDWDFVTEKTRYNNIPLESDTIYYLGKISLGNLNEELVIKFTQDDEIIASISDKVLYTDITDYGKKYPCGHFERKDKVFIHLKWFIKDTNGNFDYYNIVGTKNERRQK